MNDLVVTKLRGNFQPDNPPLSYLELATHRQRTLAKIEALQREIAAIDLPIGHGAIRSDSRGAQ